MKGEAIFCAFLHLVTCQAMAQQVTCRSSHYDDMVAMFEKEPLPDSGNIVMVGDSHTELGGDWNERLRSRYHIVNRGIVGDDASGIFHRLNQICPGTPKAIFLECGVNDLSHGLAADEVVAGIIRTVKAIRKRSPETRLFVQSVFPINETFGRWKTLDGKTDVIPEINRRLEAYCRSDNIVYVDVFSLMRCADCNSMRREICRDGLHLLPSGYDIWANAIQQCLDGCALGE